MADWLVVKGGSQLEYLVAAVFQAQGYLVRRNVPLTFGPTREDATDIDVLAIRLTHPFQPHRIICDCKERQRSRPYERIFWARGLANFVGATETYVSLPRCPRAVVDFARKGRVRVLTADVLSESYQNLYGDQRKPYGMANGAFYEKFYSELIPLLKREKAAAEILFQTRAAYLVTDPYVSLNIAFANLQQAVPELEHSARDAASSLWRFVASELVVLTSLLLLYIAADTLGLSKADRQRRIIERLTYGDLSPRKAEEIFQVARDLAVAAARSALGPESRPSGAIDLGRIDPPPYAQDIAGLVERALASPGLYHELPQLLDFLLFEQSLQGREFAQEELGRAFERSIGDEHLKIARNVMALLKTAVNLDLRLLWPRQGASMPRVSESSPRPGGPDQLSLDGGREG